MCYRRVGVDFAVLRKPRRSLTYGEAKRALILKMLDACPDLAGKTFVDLGSGCGQVCMMVAALSEASKCVGIEITHKLAQYAEKLLPLFEHALQELEIKHAPIELMEGDFLKYPLNDALKNAGLVFVNNPKFEPSLNLAILKTICPMLPRGATLICFESIIGTKGYWNDCLRYKTSLKCGPMCVSWHGHGEILHVLEKL